jgi:hypothetical protein
VVVQPPTLALDWLAQRPPATGEVQTDEARVELVAAARQQSGGLHPRGHLPNGRRADLQALGHLARGETVVLPELLRRVPAARAYRRPARMSDSFKTRGKDSMTMARMRRIINSTYVLLDGVLERPQKWTSLATRGSGGDAVQAELVLSCDAMLLGRHTYEGVAAFGRLAPAIP